jgi:alkylhydroperoxidase family enzyme
MPRISPLETREQSTETQIAFIQHKTVYNSSLTNAKSTLGHSALAFKVYMQWYPLFEETKAILGARLATLFALSISEASQSDYSSAYFRKTIIDSGEDPEQLAVSDEEQTLLNFGTAIGENKGLVPDEIFKPIRKKYTNEEIVLFTAFAGIMIANNIFNNVIQTEIDEHLQPYTPQHQTV